MTTEIDPFADAEKSPALSFKDAPVGASYTGTVTAPAGLVQQRDYLTGELATWPDGNPKMAAVVNLTVNGEPRSLWAGKPSALFAAVADAQTKAGQRIAAGGTLTVKFSGEKPNATNPRLNPQKLYEVTYVPPTGDAFAADEQPPF